jgi:ElaB/YqjD/DUF883 family membrane-anchored ribosome-binding protein
MGFLLGAFGKLAAGSRYRALQARAMVVQSKLRKVSKQVANMEKSIQAQEKLMTNQVKQFVNQQKSAELNLLEKDANGTPTNSVEYQTILTKYESMLAAQNNAISDKVEQMRESQLEPLKDLEDSLQLENDSIKTQLDVAKQDYEACQKMEQDGVKMLAPQYTAGGN